MELMWEGIAGLLGSESLPEFLRVYWNSRNRLVRKADLFKTIRSVIDDRSQRVRAGSRPRPPGAGIRGAAQSG